MIVLATAALGTIFDPPPPSSDSQSPPPTGETTISDPAHGSPSGEAHLTTTVKSFLGIVLAGVVIAALAVPFVHALGLSTVDAAAWFTAEGVVVAAVGLGAAAITAWFAYPAYHDWRVAQPHPGDMSLALEVAPAQDIDTLTRVKSGTAHEVLGGVDGLYVRITVGNVGTGVVRAGELQIAVPDALNITPTDDARLVHYRVPGSATVSGLEPGKTVQAHLSVVRDDFPPGSRMYHARIDGTLHDGSRVPLVVRLSGTGLRRPLTARSTLVARPWPI